MKNFESNLFMNQSQITKDVDLYYFLKQHIEYGSDLYIEFDLSTFISTASFTA